jgi:hypothetical protein
MDNALYCNSSRVRLDASTVLVHVHRAAGEPVQSVALFESAWDECVELQCTPKEDWVGHTLSRLKQIDRIEVGVFSAGELVGAVLLAEDTDWHVGRCLTVVTQYVLPHARHSGVSFACMRYTMILARELGYSTIAFSHRKGDWRYEIIYKRVL